MQYCLKGRWPFLQTALAGGKLILTVAESLIAFNFIFLLSIEWKVGYRNKRNRMVAITEKMSFIVEILQLWGYLPGVQNRQLRTPPPGEG